VAAADFDARDGLHAKAIKDLDRIARQPMGVTAPVLTEAAFLLEHPIQRQRLSRLIDALDVRPVEIGDESSSWAAAFEWLDRYADHRPDWSDAHLAVLSGIDRTAKVWTYDAEFRTTWRRPDGTRIPLAVR
jgi:predicted nucleic acid-binding protein